MTMTNAEWCIKNGYKFINLLAFDADNANIAYKIGLRMEDYTWKWVGKVTKLYNNKSTAVLVWLDAEHKEPILDDAEREYLSAVIKPYRLYDRIEQLTKENENLKEGKHAHWTVIALDCVDDLATLKCSRCGIEREVEDGYIPDYCEGCGAKMEIGNDE